MKDLQKMSVSELNFETQKMTEGGVWLIPSLGISAIIIKLVSVISNALSDGSTVEDMV